MTPKPRRNQTYLRITLLLAAISVISFGPAFAEQSHDKADARLQALLSDFLTARADAHGGQVTVSFSNSRVRYGPCRDPQPYLPGQARAVSGRVTVGVRCPGGRPALRYYQARVGIETDYYVAARAIESGHQLTAADLRAIAGDITRLARGVVTGRADLIGRVARRRIAEGIPVVQNMVAVARVVDRGDQVRVLARGTSFSITTGGLALNGASAGQDVRVKTDAGATVLGVANSDGTVVVSSGRAARVSRRSR